MRSSMGLSSDTRGIFAFGALIVVARPYDLEVIDQRVFQKRVLRPGTKP